MKISNLIAVLFTAALLTLSLNSNSFGNEIKASECCDAQCTTDNCCNSRETAQRKGARTAVPIIAQTLNVKNVVPRENVI